MTTLTLDDRLDRIDAQMAVLVEEAQRQRIRSAAFAELVRDMAPVGRQALAGTADRLGALDLDFAQMARLGETLLGSLAELEALIKALKPLIELAGTMSELGGPVMQMATDRLGSLDQRGYFEFMRSGAGVLDRVVTGFDEADLEALGDNVVLMLETVRDMTQPEIMLMLRRTLRSVQTTDTEDPPGLFGLLREMRSPEARRGLARLIQVLDSLGTENAQDTQEVHS